MTSKRKNFQDALTFILLVLMSAVILIIDYKFSVYAELILNVITIIFMAFLLWRFASFLSKKFFSLLKNEN